MTDALMMQMAERAFENWVANGKQSGHELWCAMVCEALGKEHNLPRTHTDLFDALDADKEQTKATLDAAFKGA